MKPMHQFSSSINPCKSSLTPISHLSSNLTSLIVINRSKKGHLQVMFEIYLIWNVDG
jgi:hypothetical protein